MRFADRAVPIVRAAVPIDTIGVGTAGRAAGRAGQPGQRRRDSWPADDDADAGAGVGRGFPGGAFLLASLLALIVAGRVRGLAPFAAHP